MNGFLPIRGTDAQGSGHYGATRGGGRTHAGIDFSCYPGTGIFPLRPGKVTKLGYPYAHDLSFRYVQVTDREGFEHRYFYVDPVVQEGEWVSEKTVLGVTQELPYEGITHHCHYEVKKDGQHIDPTPFIQSDG